MGIKTQVLVCKRFNTALTVIGKRNLRQNDHSFTWQKKNYLVDMDLPLYRKKTILSGLVHYYVYDLDNGQVVTQSEKVNMDGGIIDIILQGKLIPQLVTQMAKSGIFDAAIIGYIICIALGAFLGLFVGTTFLGSEGSP